MTRRDVMAMLKRMRRKPKGRGPETEEMFP
jgi:hypothetical protein